MAHCSERDRESNIAKCRTTWPASQGDLPTAGCSGGCGGVWDSKRIEQRIVGYDVDGADVAIRAENDSGGELIDTVLGGETGGVVGIADDRPGDGFVLGQVRADRVGRLIADNGDDGNFGRQGVELLQKGVVLGLPIG